MFLDIVERFQVLLALLIVGVKNLQDLHFDTSHERFQLTLTAMLICYLAEMMVDAIKRLFFKKEKKSILIFVFLFLLDAFVASFNRLDTKNYEQFRASLRIDLVFEKQN